MRKENIVNERDEYKYFKNKHLDRIDTIWLKPVLDDILNKFTWAKMLDHGCGNGLVGSYLKGRSNGILIGVDASRYGLEQASLKGYDDTVLVKDLSSERLPFDDGVFDFVMSSDVIEHLLDPSYAIDEIFRVLNPKGRLLISVPNPFSLFYRIKFLFSHRIDVQGYFPDSGEWDFPHIRFFTHKGLNSRLINMGFRLERDYSHFFPVYIPKTAQIPLISHFQRLLARLSPSNFANACSVMYQKK